MSTLTLRQRIQRFLQTQPQKSSASSQKKKEESSSNQNEFKQVSDDLKKLLEEQDELISKLKVEVDSLKNALYKVRAEKVDALTRVQKMECNGREMTINDLMVKYHEIKPSTPILWITTPNVSVVNAGTYANIADRLKRLCPNLDLVILTAGDFSVEQKTDEELAKEGLFRLPDTSQYNNSSDQEKRLIDRLKNMVKVFQKESTQGKGGKEFGC